jgi:hypothetical protein
MDGYYEPQYRFEADEWQTVPWNGESWRTADEAKASAERLAVSGPIDWKTATT